MNQVYFPLLAPLVQIARSRFTQPIFDCVHGSTQSVCGFPGLSKFASLRAKKDDAAAAHAASALRGNNISGSGRGKEEGNQSCSDVHKVKDGDDDDDDDDGGAFQALLLRGLPYMMSTQFSDF